MTATRRDFFISFNKADRDWAAWIAWTLEQYGYSVFFQDWDFGTGMNFVLQMHQATLLSDRLILVLSDSYLKSGFTAAEWAASFTEDPTGVQQKLLPFRVGNCTPQGLLGSIVYTDLVGLLEKNARDALLKAVATGRQKPVAPVAFPGGAASIYPGPVRTSSAEPLFWIYVRAALDPASPLYFELASQIRATPNTRLLEAYPVGALERADSRSSFLWMHRRLRHGWRV